MEYSVGQVAAVAGVSVRTLHHYDEIGLLQPSARSAAGYRLYDDADVDRLHQVLVYRGLGFSLEEVAAVLDDRSVSATEHLRRQRDLLSERIGELEDMRLTIDRLLEARSMDIKLTREEQFEIFGENWHGDEYAAEAEERWGDTDAWKQSQARTSQYTKDQWVQIKAEGDDLSRRFVEALVAGEPADGPVAMDLAEEARAQITKWFYDCSAEMHRNVAEMYIADERFRDTYEGQHEGLAQYVRDAVVANADRQAASA